MRMAKYKDPSTKIGQGSGHIETPGGLAWLDGFGQDDFPIRRDNVSG